MMTLLVHETLRRDRFAGGKRDNPHGGTAVVILAAVPMHPCGDTLRLRDGTGVIRQRRQCRPIRRKHLRVAFEDNDQPNERIVGEERLAVHPHISRDHRVLAGSYLLVAGKLPRLRDGNRDR